MTSIALYYTFSLNPPFHPIWLSILLFFIFLQKEAAKKLESILSQFQDQVSPQGLRKYTSKTFESSVLKAQNLILKQRDIYEDEFECSALHYEKIEDPDVCSAILSFEALHSKYVGVTKATKELNAHNLAEALDDFTRVSVDIIHHTVRTWILSGNDPSAPGGGERLMGAVGTSIESSPECQACFDPLGLDISSLDEILQTFSGDQEVMGAVMRHMEAQQVNLQMAIQNVAMEVQSGGGGAAGAAMGGGGSRPALGM